jgi:Cdc6-like AAA superfamily ATPase
MTENIEALPLSGRVVLLSMTHLSLTDETPVHTGQVIRATSEHLDAIDADTIGKLAEAEVNRALNRLEADGFVEMANVGDASPVGKGRPAYRLDTEVDAILETLDDDDNVAPLAEKIASDG